MPVTAGTPRKPPGSRARPGWGRAAPCAAVPAAAAVLAVLAGCSSQSSVSLPPKSAQLSAPSVSASPSPVPASAAVAAAYTAYFPASEAAESGPADRAEAVLAAYAAQPYLGQVLAQMASYRARGETAAGYVTPHITKITVHGKVAEVYDCQDASHAELVSTRTGAVIRASAGSARTFLIASLARGSDGRWRLPSLAHVDASCSPATPSSS